METDHYQQALWHFALGNLTTALSHVDLISQGTIHSSILKAQILLNLGQPQKALDVIE
jgi:hypothetical protein